MTLFKRLHLILIALVLAFLFSGITPASAHYYHGGYYRHGHYHHYPHARYYGYPHYYSSKRTVVIYR